MPSYDALEAFSGAIIEEAEKEKQELLEELTAEMEQRMKAKEKELSAKQESAVGAELGKLVMQQGVELSKIKNESKRKLIAKRAEIFEKVFAQVTENIRAYTKTQAYKDKVAADFQAVLKEIGKSPYTCFVTQEDVDLIKDAKVSNADIIGGFILEAPQKGLYFDCSLRAKIQQQKSYFYANSGLVID